MSKAKLILAALLISVVSKNIWEFIAPEFYYYCDIVAWLMFSFVIYKLSGLDYWLNRLALIAIYWSISDVIDWLFFDPSTAGWNEYVFAVVIIILVFRKRKHTWLKHQKKQGNSR